MLLVIGENITDIFIYCDCTRISPEGGAVPVLTPKNPPERTLNSGGAGNVVENLKSLGYKGIVGIHQKFEIIKTRFLANGQHVIRFDENDNCEELTIGGLIDQLSAKGLRLDRFEGVVISSYNKGLVSPQLIKDIRANYNGLIFVDTKDKKGDWCEAVDFIKINDKEWRENFGGSYNGGANIFVTKGEKGVDWVNENINIPVDKIEVVEISGAGDASLAGFVVEYLKSKNINKSLDFANRTARVAVSKKGVVAVKLEEVKL